MLWKKILLVTFNVVLAAYLVMAMSAFNKPNTEVVCSDVNIDIEESDMPGFLTDGEVRQILNACDILPVGKNMRTVNLRLMEETLEDNELIEQAECWTTQETVVNINIRQRIPVARVMNDRGEDYYMDSKGKPMPATEYSSKLIVCTGNISNQYAEEVMAPMVNIVNSDPFWKNEVVQLNVLSDGSMELVPRVGKHVVYLGQPKRIRKKLERLRKFYLYGLNVAGWNKYSRVSVEFDNQIVCTRNCPSTTKR